MVSGKATRMPDVSGECRMTAAHSYRDARSTVGTVPMLWPYRIIFSGLMPYLLGTKEGKTVRRFPKSSILVKVILQINCNYNARVFYYDLPLHLNFWGK